MKSPFPESHAEKDARRRAQRRARYNQRRAAGVCTQCGKPRGLSKWFCLSCLIKQRVRTRRLYGSKPWKPGGRGRKPMEAANA